MKNSKHSKNSPRNKLKSSEPEEAHFKITQVLQQTISVMHLAKFMEMVQLKI